MPPYAQRMPLPAFKPACVLRGRCWHALWAQVIDEALFVVGRSQRTSAKPHTSCFLRPYFSLLWLARARLLMISIFCQRAWPARNTFHNWLFRIPGADTFCCVLLMDATHTLVPCGCLSLASSRPWFYPSVPRLRPAGPGNQPNHHPSARLARCITKHARHLPLHTIQPRVDMCL